MKLHAKTSEDKPLCGAKGRLGVFLAWKGEGVDCERCLSSIRARETKPRSKLRPMAGNRRFAGRWV